MVKKFIVVLSEEYSQMKFMSTSELAAPNSPSTSVCFYATNFSFRIQVEMVSLPLEMFVEKHCLPQVYGQLLFHCSKRSWLSNRSLLQTSGI